MRGTATPATAAAPDRIAWNPAIAAKPTTTHDWAPDGRTDADCLFFGCGPDHTLVSKGILQTKVTDTGRLAWTDGTGPPEINLAHHPDELLAELDEDDDTTRRCRAPLRSGLPNTSTGHAAQSNWTDG